jgi:predicted ArsR family transcriptional regulator
MALKQSGPASIAQLASVLKLTGEAVRQQLLQLQRDGWIDSHVERDSERRSRTGRPATSYKLTAAGDHLFPKQYDTLTVSMIDAVNQNFGPEAMTQILSAIARGKVAELEPAFRNLTLDERIQALHNWYLPADPFMESSSTDGGYRLMERNCPFFNTAMSRPEICSVTVNALTRLLGYRVRREETFQRGDGRCVFRVYTDEPVDPASAEFQMESEPEPPPS